MRIEDWRAEIDAIDSQLLRLLNQRLRLALKLGSLKKSAGLPLCDPGRERDVLARARGANAGPLDDKAVAKIFRAIIRETRRLEEEAVEAPDPQAQEVSHE